MMRDLTPGAGDEDAVVEARDLVVGAEPSRRDAVDPPEPALLVDHREDEGLAVEPVVEAEERPPRLEGAVGRGDQRVLGQTELADGHVEGRRRFATPPVVGGGHDAQLAARAFVEPRHEDRAELRRFGLDVELEVVAAGHRESACGRAIGRPLDIARERIRRVGDDLQVARLDRRTGGVGIEGDVQVDVPVPDVRAGICIDGGVRGVRPGVDGGVRGVRSGVVVAAPCGDESGGERDESEGASDALHGDAGCWFGGRVWHAPGVNQPPGAEGPPYRTNPGGCRRIDAVPEPRILTRGRA